MSKIADDKHFKDLMNTILHLESYEECEAFFLDLCTIKELKDMGQRLAVAKLLNDNVIYQKIAEDTGASTATISRVSRALNYGCDGYNKVLNKAED